MISQASSLIENNIVRKKVLGFLWALRGSSQKTQSKEGKKVSRKLSKGKTSR